MKMTREQMLTKVIRLMGFENKWTIAFDSLIKHNAPDSLVKRVYNTIMNLKFDEE